MKANSKAVKSTRGSLFQPVPLANLVKAPLRELFWGLPESSLLEEAKARIEAALDLAAQCCQVEVCPESLPAAA